MAKVMGFEDALLVARAGGWVRSECGGDAWTVHNGRFRSSRGGDVESFSAEEILCAWVQVIAPTRMTKAQAAASAREFERAIGAL